MWGGVAYVSLFSLGSCLGARGRFVFLVADWLLGSGSSLLAAPWPRAHLRNLLGLEPVAGMSQGASTVALLILCVAFTGITLWRTPP